MAAESSLFGLLCVRESWCDKGRVGEQTKAIRGDLSSLSTGRRAERSQIRGH